MEKLKCPTEREVLELFDGVPHLEIINRLRSSIREVERSAYDSVFSKQYELKSDTYPS